MPAMVNSGGKCPGRGQMFYSFSVSRYNAMHYTTLQLLSVFLSIAARARNPRFPAHFHPACLSSALTAILSVCRSTCAVTLYTG